jgi:hypothetical protein
LINCRISEDLLETGMMSVGEPPSQSAKANRLRLAPKERPEILVEIDKKAADVRTNMTRLRELRLAKEAQEVPTETETRPAKLKPKKRFR